MGKTPRRRAASHGTTAGTPAQVGKPVAFRGQVRKIARHPLIVLTCGLVGAGLLGGYSFTQAPEYEAKATVLAYALPVDPLSTANSTLKVDIDSESAVADSREVARAAANILNLSEESDVKKIMSSVKSAGHSQTSILDITATASSPKDAAARANAVAQAYLQVRSEHAASDAQKAAENIQSTIDTLSKNTGANETTISELRQELARVQTASSNAGRVITSAVEPSSASGLGFPVYAGVGFAAGLIVGIPLAYLVDSRRRQLSYPDRAEEIMSAQISIIDSAKIVEDIKLTLRRAGIAKLSEPSKDYRGLVVFSPTQKVTAPITKALKDIASSEDIVRFTTKSEDIDGSHPVTVCTAPAYAELSDVLDAADALGYCLLVFTADTDVDDIARIHREVATSSATFIPVFVTK